MKDSTEFSVRVLGAQVWDPVCDNVDVVVTLQDGRKFGATFATPENIERLFEKNKATGECAEGLYLWVSNLIIIRQLSVAAIHRAVEHLLEAEEFEKAFAPLEND